MKRASMILSVVVAMTGCAASLGGPDDDGRTGTDNIGLALASSTGEEGVLRTGDSLGIRIGQLADLSPETMYRFQVTAPGGGLLSEGDLRTNRAGQLQTQTIMHDVGEDGRIEAGSTLAITLLTQTGILAGNVAIHLTGNGIQPPGWAVHEVEPPHIFASNAAGTPANAFAVGGEDPGEQGGAVHIAGDSFPSFTRGREVDVYVVTDRDEWRERDLPQSGEAGWLAGPIAVRIGEDGTLAPTAVFTPGLGHVGIYDLVVDVDRDGRFEWSFESKDGADGLGRVGFTVQYSAAWLRARTSSHILVNIAYDNHHRDAGQWTNVYDADQPVFLYLNPPVMHQYHFSVAKWIVRHQDFDTFWNNPAVADDDGAVSFAQFAINSMGTPTQTGCTNSAPTCYGVIELPDGQTQGEFDVVFDRNGDGRYTPGVDLLDIVGGDAGGGLVPVETFLSLPAAQRVGFVVQR
ncbi:MAG: hypothetical protein IT378_06105 [Sandaracinaceae bacterium]|nr:hypothetical protein [Sandaracinaceae bacterium]